MPSVNIPITRGASRDQKSRPVTDATTSLVETPGKAPGPIHAVIREIAEGDRGFAGWLTDDWKARRPRWRGGAPRSRRAIGERARLRRPRGRRWLRGVVPPRGWRPPPRLRRRRPSARRRSFGT